MKILVIGKNGFISTSFQAYMKKYSEIEVDAISAREDNWKKYSFTGYDAVYNTTGLAHNDARKGSNEQFIALNRDLPLALATKAKKDGVNTFINMSSIIVYGDMSALGTQSKITAKTKPIPAGIYGESKLAGEKAISKLEDERFHVAIIRSPLVYSERAVDNFGRLINYAIKYPIFPEIKNFRSMIYSDNLCELVKLIAEHSGSGIYCPQQDEYICTSKIVKDIAVASGHRLFLTKIFNPILFFLSKRVMFIRKVFGSLAYDMTISNCFNGCYRVVNYEESIKRLVKGKKHENSSFSGE